VTLGRLIRLGRGAGAELPAGFFVVASWGLLIGVLGEIATRYEARRQAAAAVAPAA
jgi:hypothetical protein